MLDPGYPSTPSKYFWSSHDAEKKAIKKMRKKQLIWTVVFIAITLTAITTFLF